MVHITSCNVHVVYERYKGIIQNNSFILFACFHQKNE